MNAILSEVLLNDLTASDGPSSIGILGAINFVFFIGAIGVITLVHLEDCEVRIESDDLVQFPAVRSKSPQESVAPSGTRAKPRVNDHDVICRRSPIQFDDDVARHCGSDQLVTVV